MKRFITTFLAVAAASILAIAQPPQGGGFPGGGQRQGGRPQGGMQFRMPQKPTDASFETKDINITSRGKKLYGLAVIPKGGPAKKPAIIMSHGYGGTGQGFWSQMTELGKEGYICLALDLQGGGRMGSQSEGATTEMSIFTEKQNVLDALNEIRTWDCVDTENIFLLGESQGGCVSAILAPEVQDKIKAICLIYPALCIPDDARALYKTKEDIPEVVNFMGMDIGKNYYAPVLDYDVYSVIPAFEKDVLIVHGTNDQLVKVTYSDKAASLYKNCEYHTIEGGGHGFFGEQKVTSDKYVSDFLKKEIAK